MIDIINLNKKYDKYGKKVLENVNLSFQAGNIYIIKGISGSGKTTLLNIIAGIDNNYDGTINYEGKDISSFSKKERDTYLKNIGYVTQKSLLISTLSVLDNLRFINDDIKKIMHYAKMMNIEKLLYKKPSNLSGGERQRVAIIRALLLNQKIIIADEPTASLDEKNSLSLVDIYNKLKLENKVIIIATHNDYFDKIANAVITLDYGKSLFAPRMIMENKKSNKEIIKNKFNLKLNIKYVWKKFVSSNNIISILSLTIILLIFLGLISISLNIKREYIKMEDKRMNYHVFIVNDSEFDKYSRVYGNVYKYKNYIYEEKDYAVYGLLNEEDSSMLIPDAIAVGSFPKNSNEVLINQDTSLNVLLEQDIAKAIGRTIIINNENYVVSGVLTNNDQVLSNCYNANLNYTYGSINKVFMLYDEIKKIGKINSLYRSDDIMVFRNFYLYPEVLDYISNSQLNSFYINDLNSIIKDSNLYTKWLILGLISIGIITMIFVGNQITIDLYYRRKELGYLQLFGVYKKRLIFIFILQSLLNFFISFLFALSIYEIIALITYNIFSLNFQLSLLALGIIFVALIGYILLLIYIPLSKYFKKSILQLIN